MNENNIQNKIDEIRKVIGSMRDNFKLSSDNPSDEETILDIEMLYAIIAVQHPKVIEGLLAKLLGDIYKLDERKLTNESLIDYILFHKNSMQAYEAFSNYIFGTYKECK